MGLDLQKISDAITDTGIGDRIHAAVYMLASQKTFEAGIGSPVAEEIFADPDGYGHKIRLAVLGHPDVVAALPDPSDEILYQTVQQLWQKLIQEDDD